MQEKNKKSVIEKRKRIENYEEQRLQFIREGYEEIIKTISILKANVMVLITAGPFAVFVVILYMKVWGGISIAFSPLANIIFMLAILISIPVHEFIHGFTWHFFCRQKWKSIHFGVMWEYLTPYCHCKEPLDFAAYLLGGLMPFLILGMGISVIGIMLHNIVILGIGVVNILCAGGDTTIACMLLKYRESVILDHPTECGFVAFRK